MNNRSGDTSRLIDGDIISSSKRNGRVRRGGGATSTAASSAVVLRRSNTKRKRIPYFWVIVAVVCLIATCSRFLVLVQRYHHHDTTIIMNTGGFDDGRGHSNSYYDDIMVEEESIITREMLEEKSTGKTTKEEGEKQGVVVLEGGQQKQDKHNNTTTTTTRRLVIIAPPDSDSGFIDSDGVSSDEERGGELQKLRTLQNMDSYIDTSSSSCSSYLPVHDIRTTLVLQTSLDRVYLLKEHCRRWRKDPIVAVVGLPSSGKQKTKLNKILDRLKIDNNNCPQLTIIEYHLNDQQSRPEMYPVNLLRNTGLRYGVRTSHAFLVDVDFIPSYNLSQKINAAILERQQLVRIRQRRKRRAIEKSAGVAGIIHTVLSSLLWRGQQQQYQQQNNNNNNHHNNYKEAIVVPAFSRNGKICSVKESEEKCNTIRNDESFIPRTFSELKRCLNETKECEVFDANSNVEGHSSTRSNDWLRKQWYDDDDDDDDEDEYEEYEEMATAVVSAGTTSSSSRKKNKNKIRSMKQIKCLHSDRYEPYVVIRWCPSVAMNRKDQQQQYGLLVTNNNNKPKPVAPYYDERFHGYGKNKIQYTTHLRYMGYQYFVLPNGGFTVHNPHGKTKAKTKWETSVGDENGGATNLRDNMDKLYTTFLEELHDKYIVNNKKKKGRNKNAEEQEDNVLVPFCPNATQHYRFHNTTTYKVQHHNSLESIYSSVIKRLPGIFVNKKGQKVRRIVVRKKRKKSTK